MSKNKLHEPFLLCVIVIASLLVLSLVPRFSFESIAFKRINLLADIELVEIDSVQKAFNDSLVAKQDSVIQLVRETCRPGITCIEDYSGDSTALYNFFKAVSDLRYSSKPVRIAFYGDSFIEGDVFCGSFRDSLQAIYGGKGVGFVPITSAVAGFRNTIKHSFENWRTSSLINRTDSTAEYGPAGYCFEPLEGNWVEYRPSRRRFLREFNTVKLYYKNYNDEAAVTFNVNYDTTDWEVPLRKSKQLQEWVYKGKNLKSIRFEFGPIDSVRLFGASFEDGGGVYVDNFSLRGNSGMSLTGIASDMLTKFDSYRNYKLVILQFGLNMVVEDSLDYRAYVRRMVKLINSMKKSFPQASFLLMSVSDRSTNSHGKFETMNAIPAMRNAQRMIAQEAQIAFWDLFQAMGGENSMVRFVTSKPALAAKDYTHLNFKGGRKLAGSLVKSMLYSHEQHRMKYGKRK